MNITMQKVNECVKEYGVNKKKSKVMCTNSDIGRRRWKMEKCYIGELE